MNEKKSQLHPLGSRDSQFSAPSVAWQARRSGAPSLPRVAGRAVPRRAKYPTIARPLQPEKDEETHEKGPIIAILMSVTVGKTARCGNGKYSENGQFMGRVGA